MSESSSVETSPERERVRAAESFGRLSRDMANPAMYAPAAFPRPKKDAATLVPSVPRQNEQTANADTVANDGELDCGKTAILNDGASSRRGRASQALAEMKNAAQQRGLLKTSDVPERGTASQSEILALADANPTEPAGGISDSQADGGEEAAAAAEETAESSEAAEKPVAAESDSEAGTSSPKQIEDASRLERLAVLADWLTDSIGMSEVFLIDSCGYSLLPEKPGKTNGEATARGRRVGAVGALHDLGLRLGAVLDLAGRRLARECSDASNDTDSDTETDNDDEKDDETELRSAAGVARLTLDEGRGLAVARVAMTESAERPLLGWVEPLRKPLADSWVESACDYTAKVLAHDFMS